MTPTPEQPKSEQADADRALVFLSMRITAVFTVVSAVTYLLADRIDRFYAVACTVAFVVGVVLFGLGMWNGIQRSRVDEVTLTGLVAIDGSHVPKSTRNLLWVAIVVQLVVSILFASLRPFTQQAFGLLVPTVGLGLATLWGSRFAAFHPRDDT